MTKTKLRTKKNQEPENLLRIARPKNIGEEAKEVRDRVNRREMQV